MIRPSIATVLFLTAVAGCTAVDGTGEAPETVAIKNPGINNKRITGFQEITVRSYVPRPKPETVVGSPRPSELREEIAGAKCIIETAEFYLSFTTPRTLALPKFTARPTRGTVKCEAPHGADAVLAGGVQITPIPNTPVFGAPTPSGLLVSALTAGLAVKRDIWVYSIPPVMLQQVPLQADEPKPGAQAE